MIQAIFLQHATEGTSLAPGAAFKAACASLVSEYDHLKALENVALEGRLFEMMDAE